MAIMVGTGRGAGAGVLIKNAEALERLEKVDTLVVDKTGTLTEGKPKLAQVRARGAVPGRGRAAAGRGVEQASEHPLAAAIVAGARERGIRPPEVSGFDSVTGGGVKGTVDGRAVLHRHGRAARRQRRRRVGARRRGGRAARRWADGDVRGRGRTPAGTIGVSDPIKASTPEAIRLLHEDGLRIVMLTGDNEVTAKAVASKLGPRRGDRRRAARSEARRCPAAAARGARRRDGR
jgi:P-type Cu+ transporter